MTAAAAAGQHGSQGTTALRVYVRAHIHTQAHLGLLGDRGVLRILAVLGRRRRLGRGLGVLLALALGGLPGRLLQLEGVKPFLRGRRALRALRQAVVPRRRWAARAAIAVARHCAGHAERHGQSARAAGLRAGAPAAPYRTRTRWAHRSSESPPSRAWNVLPGRIRRATGADAGNQGKFPSTNLPSPAHIAGRDLGPCTRGRCSSS